MATTRKPKALVEAEKKIAELEKKLAQCEEMKSYYSKQLAEEKDITDGLHDVLDDLGVRGYRDENKYTRIPLAVRLFAWALKTKAEQ